MISIQQNILLLGIIENEGSVIEGFPKRPKKHGHQYETDTT